MRYEMHRDGLRRAAQSVIDSTVFESEGDGYRAPIAPAVVAEMAKGFTLDEAKRRVFRLRNEQYWERFLVANPVE
jgi:hypothetical protein